MEFSKHQDKERLLSLDNKWELIPFQELFDSYSGGKHKIKKGDYLGSGEYPIIDQGEKFIGGYTNDPEKLIDGPLPKVIFGDHTRRFKYIDFRFGVGADGTKILTPKKECYVKYLYYYFKSINLPDTGYNRHFKYLKRFIVPLPPLEIQKKIAAILDKADALRQKRRETINLLDKFISAFFQEKFANETSKSKKISLSEVCQKITDGTHQSPNYISDGIPFLFVSDIKNGDMNFDTDKYISEEEYRELYKRTPVEIGDILLSTVGSYGNPVIVKTNKKFMFQRHIAYLKPDHNKIDYVYLYGALQSSFVQNQIEKEVRGVAQKTLNLTQLKEIEIYLPSMPLQKKFSKTIKKIEKVKKNKTSSSETLDRLFNSLLQKAFKGELHFSESEEALLAAEEAAEYSA